MWVGWSKEPEADEEDAYETRIRNSGCADQHYALQDCYLETKDWRKCSQYMSAFRVCMKDQAKNSVKKSHDGSEN